MEARVSASAGVLHGCLSNTPTPEKTLMRSCISAGHNTTADYARELWSQGGVLGNTPTPLAPRAGSQ